MRLFPERPFHATALSLLAALVLLAGCDLSGNDNDEPIPASTTAFVANQGNFSDANGSVSTFDFQTGAAAPAAIGPDVLGSTTQSLQIEDDRLFVVSNTAQRVDVFDANTLERTAQSAAAFENPRYLSIINDEKAYLTNQSFEGPSTVEVLDLSVDSLPSQTSIEVSGSPEKITVAGDRAYVGLGAFGASTNVAVINTNTDELVEEIDVGCEARFVLADQNVPGSEDEAPQGQAVVLDGPTGDERNRIDLSGPVRSASGVTQAAAHAPSIREMFVVVDENRLVRLNTTTNELAVELGPLDGAPIGAVGFDPATDRLLLGRVPGFDVSGSVTLHTSDGTQTDEFAAGIAPTDLDLRRDE